jgi:hypothetical protein
MLTIAETNDDRSLLSISEVRVAAGLHPDDDSKDALLSPLNNYVAALITKACKVARAGAIPPTLRDEVVTETFVNKSLQKYLVLARRPVILIMSITQTGSSLASTDYISDDAAGIIYKNGGDFYAEGIGHCGYWPSGNTVIQYNAGYEEVPDDLKYAAMKFINAEYSKGDRDPSLKSLTIQGVSSREWWVSEQPVTSVIPSEVMDILIRGGYVNMVIA